MLFLELVVFIDNIKVILLRFLPFLDNGTSCDRGSRLWWRFCCEGGIRVWPGLLLLYRLGTLDCRLETKRGCVELSISGTFDY